MTHSPLPYPTSVRSSLHDIRSQISLLPAQRRVLEVVEGAGQPISSAEVAKTLKLHPNTAREHLDASGAVAPSAVSSAEAASPAAATSDAVAAEPSHLSETGANTAAEANMTQRLENAIAQLRPIFTVMGFAPELAKNKLVLHSCPFAKGGWPHPLVCIIHEAYIAELLTRSSGVRVVSSAELKLHPQLASTCLVELKRNKTTCSVGVCDCSQPTPHAASRH